MSLPPPMKIADVMRAKSSKPRVVIPGILRKGRKMLMVGSSKSGKSLLLMELCVAIASGGRWLGIDIPQGRVIYVNFEIAADAVRTRFADICGSLGVPVENENLLVWNLRGYSRPLTEMIDELIGAFKAERADVVILDPVYKIITGDENSAAEMGAFANQLDRICAETGAAVIYCHHHTKGTQKTKAAIDRASGSGVFARDPDAFIDLLETREKGRTLWKMQAVLREFPEMEPVFFSFEYPLHRRVNDLAQIVAQLKEKATVEAVAEKLGVTPPTARKRLREAGYLITRGAVRRE